MTGAWAWVHDLFDIIGGIAAAVAVAFSVWIAFRERSDRQAAERDRDEARAAEHAALDRERVRELESQARRVVIWTGRLGKFADDGRLRMRLHASIGNYSDMPILNVSLRVNGELSSLRGHPWTPFEAGGNTLMPQTMMAGTVVDMDGRKILTFEPSATDRGAISFQFEDAAGYVWERDDLGRLRLVGGGPGPSPLDD